MHSTHSAEPAREPVYLDEFGGRHHPPPSPSNYQRRASRPRYQEPPEPEYRRRPRARTYQAPPPPNSYNSRSSPSISPPPRHRRRHSPRPPPTNYARAPRPESPEPYRGYYSTRARRPAKEDEYFSDNQHNRPRRDPYRDAYHEPPSRSRYYDDREPREYRDHRDRRMRDRDARYRESDRYAAPPPPRHRGEKREIPKWQKEAKNMFVEYAVPVIKAEGGKYISKQIGNMIAKRA